MTTIRWGILGPGRIARKFAAGLREAAGAELIAVGSRDRRRADTFAAEFGVPNAHGNYEDLAADPAVDAVYVASPHAGHEEHTLLCLEHGKHVLCEKPLAINRDQAERMVEAAKHRNLALMEGVWTRFLPALVRARELVDSGAIGEVRLVSADFGFRAAFDPDSRLFAPELGGGTLLDLGIYPLNLAFWFCGRPTEILTTANLGATGVDEEAAIILRHPEGRLSVMATSFRTDTPREAHIVGADGRIRIPCPWWGAGRIVIVGRDGAEKEHDLPARGGGFAHEAEEFMDLIRAGRLESAIMPWDESLAILGVMDEIRSRWGVRYPGE